MRHGQTTLWLLLVAIAGWRCSRPTSHGPSPTADPAASTSSGGALEPGQAVELPGAVERFAAGPPTTGPGFVRRTYSRGPARVTVTLARLDLGPGGYDRWVSQSRQGYPQAPLDVVPESAGNGFYECSDDAMARCNLLIQLRSGVHLEIRGEDGASRADVDAVAAALPLRTL